MEPVGAGHRALQYSPPSAALGEDDRSFPGYLLLTDLLDTKMSRGLFNFHGVARVAVAVNVARGASFCGPRASGGGAHDAIVYVVNARLVSIAAGLVLYNLRTTAVARGYDYFVYASLLPPRSNNMRMYLPSRTQPTNAPCSRHESRQADDSTSFCTIDKCNHGG